MKAATRIRYGVVAVCGIPISDEQKRQHEIMHGAGPRALGRSKH